MRKICGKNIVLTGCDSGIGYEFLKLIAADNKVLCVDVNTARLDELAKTYAGITVMKCDVSTEEGVDAMFAEAEHIFPFIDIFYANAGFAYYEKFNYADWDRIDYMMRTNCYSPMYSYGKYLKYLDGREGRFCVTASAIGKMSMPGYTLYSASKFCVQGFQEGLRLEDNDNVTLTVLYPIATATNFFAYGSDGRSRDEDRPFPVQKPDHVARRMYVAVAKGKKYCNPSMLFSFAMQLFKFLPVARKLYWAIEKAKFRRYCKRENID